MSPVSPERVKALLCARSAAEATPDGAGGRSRHFGKPGTVGSESRVS